jgi:hypothetical protein
VEEETGDPLIFGIKFQDTLNPVWRKKLVVEYRFEERQILLFKVFDRDSPSEDLQVGAVIK